MHDLKLSVSEVNQIYKELNSVSGFDFSNYAFSFKMRKIILLMHSLKILNIEDFIFRLQNSQHTVSEFVKSMFVSYSEMFRDAEMWNYLQEKIFSKLLLKKEVKIHIPYCVTGEELYSLMFFSGLYKSTHISILVSHPLSENEELIKNRIFTQKDLKACQKNIEILDFVKNTEDVFAGHTNQMRVNHIYRGELNFEYCNVLNQQHIAEFDLVLFRNRLIYYNDDLQTEVLRKISGSMNKGGLLIIGEKETLGQMSGKYKNLKSNLSVYKKRIF
ncbi:MAG: hypothetical protein J7K64_02655 [Bacteroidales bacterium]|nr:hypothetical protein [Bacteroidales bacterium]